MKKIVWVVLLALTIGSVCGCQEKEAPAASEENAPAATKEAVMTGKTEEPAVAEETGKLGTAPDKTEAVSQKPAQSYYGKWKVEQYYSSYITAVSREEMEALIGAECEYEADYFISGETRLDSPQYSESTETEQRFDEANNQSGINFRLLGITADAIRQISIDNSYGFGSVFYVKDENTIMIIYEGVFFEAVRQQ